MRRVLRLYCLALLLLAPAAQAQGFLPGTRPAECAYLRTVLACMDRLGNHYSVATGIGFGGDPLPADLHGKGDALHADPVQGKIGGGGLAGDIGKRQGIHGELEEG